MRVLLEVARRVLEAVADVGVGLQVEDDVAARDRVARARRGRARRPRRASRRRALERLDELAPAGAEVVVDDDLDAVGEQPVGEVAADEAGAAGDERALHALRA